MSESCKIYIDRLKGVVKHLIQISLDPSFLDVNEPELSFPHPVELKGEAYLTDEHLVLHFDAYTRALRPCAICNQRALSDLEVHHFYHTELLQDIPSAIFDFTEVLREALLSELPLSFECNGGNCPEREEIAPFLSSKKRKENPTYFPFNDMNLPN